MKQKKGIKLEYRDYYYPTVWKWYPAHTYTKTVWDKISKFPTVKWGYIDVEVKVPGYYHPRTDYLNRKVIINNRFTYYNSYGYRWTLWYAHPKVGRLVRACITEKLDRLEEGVYYKIKACSLYDIMDPWDEKPRTSIKRNWKRTHKVRKQWMKNLED